MARPSLPAIVAGRFLSVRALLKENVSECFFLLDTQLTIANISCMSTTAAAKAVLGTVTAEQGRALDLLGSVGGYVYETDKGRPTYAVLSELHDLGLVSLRWLGSPDCDWQATLTASGREALS